MQNSILITLNIFHQFFVNVDDTDSFALTKHAVLGEIGASIFGQAKNARYMHNVATNMNLDN